MQSFSWFFSSPNVFALPTLPHSPFPVPLFRDSSLGFRVPSALSDLFIYVPRDSLYSNLYLDNTHHPIPRQAFPTYRCFISYVASGLLYFIFQDTLPSLLQCSLHDMFRLRFHPQIQTGMSTMFLGSASVHLRS